MFVRNLGETVTVELYGDDCELLARALRMAAGSFDQEILTADAMRGFFIAAAVICRMHGSMNVPAAVTKELGAILARVEKQDD